MTTPTRSRKAAADARRLLELVSEGYTDEQIAGLMFISVRTVKNRVQALRTRFGARNRPQLIGCAYRAGLLGGTKLGPEGVLTRLGDMLGVTVVVSRERRAP